MNRSHSLVSAALALSLVGLAGLASLAGCAAEPTAARPARIPATTTGADVTAPSAAFTAPSAAVAEPAALAEAPADIPPGRLVCRTTNPVDGTTELYLDWTGKQAKGVLRRVAPSGIVHADRVAAERTNGIIVVDDPGETDLVTHAALLQQSSGKLQMRLGSGASGTWSACGN